ncbi:MAG: alpha/beta fold hydrolase [Elusimicrobia bacterium]|nr:alpha/beta fold hydrolase [Elusimicrobiota bacterium]
MRHRLTTRIAPLIFLAGSLFGVSAALAQNDCEELISSLPDNYVRGHVSVPENWDEPQGEKIEVFYYGRLRPGSGNPVVAVFNGGPSSDSHGLYRKLSSDPRSAGVDFVFMDQRGTGCSTPYPPGESRETARRLTGYTSRAIVHDAEAVRRKLLGRNGKWRIFGQSYGGLIVHRYLAVAPGSLEAAYSHGYAVMTDQVEWMKERILSQDRVADDYFRGYPQDRQLLETIRARIPPDKCFTDEGSTICGPAMIDAIRHPLGFRNSWEDMHWWIDTLSQQNEYSDNMMNGFLLVYATDFTRSKLPSSVINKVEINKGASDVAECAEASRRLRAAGDDPDLWPVNECRIIAAVKNERLDSLLDSVTGIDPLTLDAVRTSLAENPSLKLYLYAGRKDTFVPVDTFREEVSVLGGLVEYTAFPDSGHEGYSTEGKVWDDLLRRP